MTRVQVRDLPDAPQLQATVQSGGNFGVSVEQAGSNKLTELANTLSGFNSALNEYKALAVTDAEMHSDELKWLSPEELTERLSKTEGELDSMSRKGLIPWLASPLNQKRKRRALGKAAHDVFVQRLLDSKGRLENPQEGDSDLTTAEIIEEERQAFISDKPALQQGTYGSEGFQEVLNPTILNLTRQYDGRKATVAKGETLLQNTSAIYRLAKDAPLEPNEYGLYMEQSLRAQDGGAGPWAELNSFNAAQQIKVIENVAEQLANLPGGEQRAYEFLQYAEDNFYVGNQLFYKNEDQVDRIMNSIEREVETAQRIREGGRDERLETERSEFVVALSAVENTGKGMYKGVEYTDKFQINKAAQRFAREDDDVRFRGPAIEQFEQVFKGDHDTLEHQRGLMVRKSTMVRQAPTRVNNIFESILSSSNVLPDIKNTPQYQKLYNETQANFGDKVIDKQDALIRAGAASNFTAAGLTLDAFILDELEKTQQAVKFEVQALSTAFKDESEKENKARNDFQFNETEPVGRGFLEFGSGVLPSGLGDNVLKKTALGFTAPMLYPFVESSPEEVTSNVVKNLEVAANKATTDENRKIAFKYVKENTNAALEHLATIAAPNSKKRRDGLGVSPPHKGFVYASALFTAPMLLPYADEMAETLMFKTYTSTERKTAKELGFKIRRVFTEEFLNLKTLEEQITSNGDRFEIGTDVNSFNTVLTTPKQIEEALKAGSNINDVPAEVKKIAELVGEEDDILNFITNQKRNHKALEFYYKK
jgi:hypothetical protein